MAKPPSRKPRLSETDLYAKLAEELAAAGVSAETPSEASAEKPPKNPKNPKKPKAAKPAAKPVSGTSVSVTGLMASTWEAAQGWSPKQAASVIGVTPQTPTDAAQALAAMRKLSTGIDDSVWARFVKQMRSPQELVETAQQAVSATMKPGLEPDERIMAADEYIKAIMPQADDDRAGTSPNTKRSVSGAPDTGVTPTTTTAAEDFHRAVLTYAKNSGNAALGQAVLDAPPNNLVEHFINAIDQRRESEGTLSKDLERARIDLAKIQRGIAPNSMAAVAQSVARAFDSPRARHGPEASQGSTFGTSGTSGTSGTLGKPGSSAGAASPFEQGSPRPAGRVFRPRDIADLEGLKGLQAPLAEGQGPQQLLGIDDIMGELTRTLDGVPESVRERLSTEKYWKPVLAAAESLETAIREVTSGQKKMAAQQAAAARRISGAPSEAPVSMKPLYQAFTKAMRDFTTTTNAVILAAQADVGAVKAADISALKGLVEERQKAGFYTLEDLSVFRAAHETAVRSGKNHATATREALDAVHEAQRLPPDEELSVEQVAARLREARQQKALTPEQAAELKTGRPPGYKPPLREAITAKARDFAAKRPRTAKWLAGGAATLAAAKLLDWMTTSDAEVKESVQRRLGPEQPLPTAVILDMLRTERATMRRTLDDARGVAPSSLKALFGGEQPSDGSLRTLIP